MSREEESFPLFIDYDDNKKLHEHFSWPIHLSNRPPSPSSSAAAAAAAAIEFENHQISKRPKWEITTPFVSQPNKIEKISFQNKALLLWSLHSNRIPEPSEFLYPRPEIDERKTYFSGLATARLKLCTNLLQQIIPPLPKPIMFSNSTEVRECSVYMLARICLHHTSALVQQARSRPVPEKSHLQNLVLDSEFVFNLNSNSNLNTVDFDFLHSNPFSMEEKYAFDKKSELRNEKWTTSKCQLGSAVPQARIRKRRAKLFGKFKAIEQKVNNAVDSPSIELSQLIQEQKFLEETSSLVTLRQTHGPDFLANVKRDRNFKSGLLFDSELQKRPCVPNNSRFPISSLFRSNIVHL